MIFFIPGNYYSLRSEHQKAVMYFQRALALDPQYLSAWILMGHEFIELQNSNAAIQCYRQAIGKSYFLKISSVFKVETWRIYNSCTLAFLHKLL